ncbi:hypothetical protein BC939DRAFT_508585 [Gamsiella multidivaricata]|uniref:uncharacterized protein n=1 Tax=Gamsiella multidivaricata TaxID=101098 RepID=UPI00221F3752|nr:uncharacterized protein BC939DRAFT_508585 [Gamsiella multidivaricata]KAI7816138.1 hypothetical protein BC939DRAFT_508585 [Gamsiella multidivaricata]
MGRSNKFPIRETIPGGGPLHTLDVSGAALVGRGFRHKSLMLAESTITWRVVVSALASVGFLVLAFEAAPINNSTRSVTEKLQSYLSAIQGRRTVKTLLR